MPPETTSSNVDWRPYRLTAIALMLALALNLWTANRLWLSYSLIGASGFTIIVVLVARHGLRLPSLAVWLVGVAAALHYVGGSMAGLHRFGGDNGLYFAFPWWDNVVHFLGTFAVGAAAAAMLGQPTPKVRWFLATCVGVTVGVLVELYEFSQFVLFATVDQGFYTNTLIDLYNNLLGAAAGAAAYVRFEPVASPASPQTNALE